MRPNDHCPTCGTPVDPDGPDELCPRCLIGLALDDPHAGDAADDGALPAIGRFEVLERLGRGGMGEVWLARDPRLDRRVALKLLPPQLAYDVELRARFLDEARAAAALDHPYICHIHEVGSWEGIDYIAMEYVEGTTLEARLAEGGPLPFDEAVRHGLAIAEALEAAHEKRLVHRDLKPANLMITRQGHVKVMDFGLAKRLAPEATPGDADARTVTQAGTVLGTVAYMSPEQVRGEPLSTASDLFAFGIVMHEMLDGEHPFARTGLLETAHAIVADAPPPLVAKDAPGALRPSLAALVKRLLAKRATERGSVHAARATLADLAAGRVPAGAASGRRPLAVAVAGLGLAAIVVGTALAYEKLGSRTPAMPTDDGREVYVSLAFDRWGVRGDAERLLEVSRKLRSRLEEIFADLPDTDVVVRPEVFDAATFAEWSPERSHAGVVASLRALDVPPDLVLRNRLEEPEPGAFTLLSSLQRLHGERLVGIGRYVRAEGAAADVLYLTLRVAFGFWLELSDGAGTAFTEADRVAVRRRVLEAYREVLAFGDDAALQDAVTAALEPPAAADQDVAVLLDAYRQSLDAEALAERIAARRRADLLKLELTR